MGPAGERIRDEEDSAPEEKGAVYADSRLAGQTETASTLVVGTTRLFENGRIRLIPVCWLHSTYLLCAGCPVSNNLCAIDALRGSERCD